MHYDIHLDGGLFLIPPGWTWIDMRRAGSYMEGYMPDHCEDCHHLEACDADGYEYMLDCEVHKITDPCRLDHERMCVDCDHCAEE